VTAGAGLSCIACRAPERIWSVKPGKISY
jgi:hypothetical protein